MKLTASHASRPKVGESMNGDAVVFRHEGSRGLLAVVDALGHGPTAAAVASVAVRHLESVMLDADVRDVVTGLHRALRGSRGAAAMICRLDGNRIDGCGVGNVELRVAGSDVPAVLSPGILGSNVRSFRVFGGQLHHRSRIALFTDGISARFQLDSLRHLKPGELSEQLVAIYGRSYDDATALIVDFE